MLKTLDRLSALALLLLTLTLIWTCLPSSSALLPPHQNLSPSVDLASRIVLSRSRTSAKELWQDRFNIPSCSRLISGSSCLFAHKAPPHGKLQLSEELNTINCHFQASPNEQGKVGSSNNRLLQATQGWYDYGTQSFKMPSAQLFYLKSSSTFPDQSHDQPPLPSQIIARAILDEVSLTLGHLHQIEGQGARIELYSLLEETYVRW